MTEINNIENLLEKCQSEEALTEPDIKLMLSSIAVAISQGQATMSSLQSYFSLIKAQQLNSREGNPNNALQMESMRRKIQSVSEELEELAIKVDMWKEKEQEDQEHCEQSLRVEIDLLREEHEELVNEISTLKQKQIKIRQRDEEKRVIMADEVRILTEEQEELTTQLQQMQQNHLQTIQRQKKYMQALQEQIKEMQQTHKKDIRKMKKLVIICFLVVLAIVLFSLVLPHAHTGTISEEIKLSSQLNNQVFTNQSSQI